MAKKRPARKGNPDLRQQHVPAPQIEQIAILLNAISFLD
ncbi:IS4 transposase [Nostoc flagelliforme CCNUN1]|uniref:IS4 transposase n=1 Tax=Nostoc flagelliforme CCNUN1 TaxID=2038116 RepID=A0A2K8SX98_9NOSO|nr:IS4 transposase [Nostoc flagelliforme CCNUN1]